MNPPNFQTPPGQTTQLRPRKSGPAIGSMVLGLLSIPLIFLCVGWLTAVAAIVLGAVALAQLSKGPSHITGKGMATTGIVSAIAAIGIYSIFLAMMPKPEPPTAAEGRISQAATLIMSDSKGTSHGNTEKAKELAKKYGETMFTMQKEFFVREGGEAKIQLSGGNFVTFCQINEKGVAFLVHVPEYRRYEDDAKESLSELAWLVANLTVTSDAELAAKSPQIGVAMKGAILFGDVMLGELGEEKPSQSDLDKLDLEPFFTSPEDDEAPAASDE